MILLGFSCGPMACPMYDSLAAENLDFDATNANDDMKDGSESLLKSTWFMPCFQIFGAVREALLSRFYGYRTV